MMNRLYKRLTRFLPLSIFALIVLTVFPAIQVVANPLSSTADHPTGRLSLINVALGIVLSQAANPPPATMCADVNFEDPGAIRSNFTNEADRDELYCRLIANSGRYMRWNGKSLTNAGNIGNEGVLNLRVVGAVDVFSMSGKTGFQGDVNICIRGRGYMIYLNAATTPRVPELYTAWRTDAFPGYTCTTLYAPGMVVLVRDEPE